MLIYNPRPTRLGRAAFDDNCSELSPQLIVDRPVEIPKTLSSLLKNS